MFTAGKPASSRILAVRLGAMGDIIHTLPAVAWLKPRYTAVLRRVERVPARVITVVFIVIAAVIAVTQGVRKITVQYAKRVVGRKMYGGQTQYMPLKVNYAGVMPIIFAWALLLFPTTIVSVVRPPVSVRVSVSSAAFASASGIPSYASVETSRSFGTISRYSP